jgi:uncharacterized phage-associated protein
MNEKKLQTLIAYIALKTTPGKVKLFKLLYLMDFTAFVELGESITGETYDKLPLGPVPRYLRSNFAKVTKECVIGEYTHSGMSIPEYSMRARSSAVDMSIFSATEREIIERVLSENGTLTGAALTRKTHAEVPYLVTTLGAEIPYYLAGLRNFKRSSHADIKALLDNPAYQARLLKALDETETDGIDFAEAE